MPLRGFARQSENRSQRKGVSNDLVLLGGLVEEEHSTAVRPADLLRARNVCRKGRTTGTRPGLDLLDGGYNAEISPGAGVGIQAIYEFRRNRDADRSLIVLADGAVYTDYSTALNLGPGAVTISNGDDYRWTFANHANIMYAAGGNIGTDSIWYWDGSGNPTEFSNASLATMGISAGARYVFQKWNFLFLGGLGGTAGGDNPMVARYCNYGTDPRTAANWAAANVIPGTTLGDNFGAGSYGEEYNTGFGSFQSNRNDFLLFLTNKRLIMFEPNLALTGSSTAFSMAGTVESGCVHQNCFVNLGVDAGDAVFLSNEGIHSLAIAKQYGDRTASTFLSWPIRKTFAQLNRSRLKFATSAYWPEEGLIFFLVTKGSGSTNNLILCMDIKDVPDLTPDTVRWYTWDFSGITPNVIAAARGTDDKPYVYLGDLAGRVPRFNRTSYSDLGGSIYADIITKNDDYDMPYKQKTIGDTFVALQGNGDYQISHQLLTDDGQRLGQSTLLAAPGGGALWGSFNWGAAEWGSNESTIRHRISSVGSSPTISHRFTHTTANQPFWLSSLSQEIFTSGSTSDVEANPVG